MRVESVTYRQSPGGETGRRTGLKIPGPERDVSVRFRSRAPADPSTRFGISAAALRLRSGPRLSPASLTPAQRLNLSDRPTAGSFVRNYQSNSLATIFGWH